MSTTKDEPSEKGSSSSDLVVVSPAKIERVMEAAKALEWLKSNLLTPSDYQKIGDRYYIKKSGWMKIALACGISLEKRLRLVEQPKPGVTLYHYDYRAIAPNGRFADAVGDASTDERQFTHPYHDPDALAQTRATNRAVSNLVGSAEVSAEELTSENEGAKEEKAEVVKPKPSPATTTEGTETPSESPVPQTASPTQEAAKPKVVPKLVPLTAELRTFEGVKQFPLEKDGRSYGTINWALDGSELTVIPEHEVLRDCASVGSLVYGPRSKTFEGFEQMKMKHGFTYHVEVQDGVVKWILLQATKQPIDEKHAKQLQSTARWAFENAPKRGVSR